MIVSKTFATQRSLGRLPYYAVVPVLLLLGWLGAVEIELLPEYLLPPPSQVFGQVLPEGFLSGELLVHTVATLRRTLLGTAISTSIAIPVGIILGFSSGAYQYSTSTINALRGLPPVALIPLAIVWFGIGDSPALFLIVFATYWPILLNAISAVRGVDPLLSQTALTLGANPPTAYEDGATACIASSTCRWPPNCSRGCLEHLGDCRAACR